VPASKKAFSNSERTRSGIGPETWTTGRVSAMARDDTRQQLAVDGVH
jgi:hypothetical protein